MPRPFPVSAGGRLILVSGLGSVLRPLVGTRLMASFDINGVFYFMAAAALALALVAWFGSLRTASPLHQERPFLPPQASLLAHAARSCSEEPSSAYPSEAAPA